MNLCPHCNAYHSTEFARCPSCAGRSVSSNPPNGSNGAEADDATFAEDSHTRTRVREVEPMSGDEPAPRSPPLDRTARRTDDGIGTWDTDVQMIGEVVEWQVRTLFHTPLDPEELPVDPEELP